MDSHARAPLPTPAPPAAGAAACPLCRASERRVVYARAKDVFLGHPGAFDIVECSACRLRFVDPRPAGETLAGYYADTEQHVYPNHRPGAGLTLAPAAARWLLHEERAYPAPGGPEPDALSRRAARAWLDDPQRRERVLAWSGQGRLLDVGCGSGAYLALMQSLGWTVTGVDLFEEVAREVGARLGVPCHAGDLAGIRLPARSFDAITFWHVLEHLPDPRTALVRAGELLAPGGVLAIGVPVYDCREEELLGAGWLGYDVPRHLITFSRARLASLLEELGFRVVAMASEPAPWVLRQGAKLPTVGPLWRLVMRHRLTRDWFATRLADAHRSGKVVALARRD